LAARFQREGKSMATQDPNEMPGMQPKKKGGCFGCSWGGVIPAGCLGALLLCGGGVGGFFYFVINVIKQTPIYAESVQKAKDNAEVQAVLGTPISEGWMIQGKVNVVNNSGNADFTIPLTGPKGSGNIHVVATMTNGKWSYNSLTVVTETKEINLLTNKAGEKDPDL